MLLEIACFSLDSALVAAAAGADRIEFCKNYAIGGKSPSPEDVAILREKTKVPIYVMIRTRSGNFNYTAAEIEAMHLLIKQFLEIGVNGFVFGCLNSDKTIDVESCLYLLKAAAGKPCTFHRAIDEVPDFEASIKTLVDLGFSSVLTSGHNCNAEVGFNALQKAQAKFGHHISIIAGGGVRSSNIELLLATGCKAYHSAALDEDQKISKTEIETLKKKILAYEKN